MELESKEYFAIPSLSRDPRWRHGQTYLFRLDRYGYQLFSGNPLPGQTAPELVGARTGSSAFSTRDLARVADTFGETVRQVRVEVHLSNGVELGATPNVDLVAGQTRSVELDASSQTFDNFSVHVEIGSGEHGGGGEGGREGGGG